jgi:type I restriction enzyme S subunit
MLKLRWETEFKETEIGEIPRDWEVRKLSEILVEIIKGKNPKKYLGDLPYLSAKYLRGEAEAEEFYDETAGILVDENEIIVIWDGSNSGEVFKSKKGILASTMCKLLFNEKIANKTYAYFALKANEEDIKCAKSGTDDRHVDKEYFLNFLIPLPPLSQQSRIATVLSWFDDLIEVKKRQNEILEKTAMAIFKSWFIDFEPFRSCPEQERGNYEFVYNEELGREIPKGWEVKKLGEVVKTQYGITISGENFGEIKLLRITDINKTFVIDWDSVPYCNLHEKMFYKYNLSDKDIVISRIADIGKVAIIEDPPKSVFASYLIRLKIKSDSNIKPYYLYYWLKSEIYQEYILGAGEGSTRENTNAEVIKDGPILIPDISILQKFEELACDLRSKIILNQKQIMTLRKIRDTLLPLLVFGKLRLEEI